MAMAAGVVLAVRLDLDDPASRPTEEEGAADEVARHLEDGPREERLRKPVRRRRKTVVRAQRVLPV